MIAGVKHRRTNPMRPFYVELDGKRHPVRLHDLGLNPDAVELVRARLKELGAIQAAGLPVPRGLAEWLGSVNGKLRRRIEKGFPKLELPARDKRLGEHLGEYFERPTDRKLSTMAAIRTTAKKLVTFFG